MLYAVDPHPVSEPDAGGGRPHTFLVADLAAFVVLTEAHRDGGAADLADAFARLVRPLVRRYRCQEVKTIGDAIMIRADEARAAVEVGLAIVAELERQPEFPVARVGMHTGPAAGRGRDWLGTTSSGAARVCAAAGGGEVLLTEATGEATGELAGVEFERHGEVRLRNGDEPVTLVRAVRVGETRGRLVIDPVCRMVVAPGQAAGELAFEGVMYRFCSLGCAAAFAAAPDRYAERPGADG